MICIKLGHQHFLLYYLFEIQDINNFYKILLIMTLLSYYIYLRCYLLFTKIKIAKYLHQKLNPKMGTNYEE